MNQVKQTFRTQNTPHTMADSVRQHHLSLLRRYQSCRRHLDSMQSLKESEAVVSAFWLQIQWPIPSFSISALKPFGAESFFVVGAVCIVGSLPGLFPLDVSSNLQARQPKISRHFQMSPGWQITTAENYLAGNFLLLKQGVFLNF